MVPHATRHGRIYALDTRTGQQIWVFHTVPDSGPAGATWTNKSDTNPPSGGGLWTSFSLDPANGVLYVPTGNPGLYKVLHSKAILYMPMSGLVRSRQTTPRVNRQKHGSVYRPV